MISPPKTATVAALLALFALSACDLGPEPTPENEFDDLGKADSPGSGYLGATELQYEGSCNFLLSCSGPSVSAGTVLWGCGGSGCSMSDRWVAVPDWRTFMCGETVTICRGDTCTEAEVRDVSCCGRWEASHAVLEDLGVPHDSSAQSCTGYGSAHVKIYRGAGQGGDSSGGDDFNGTYCAEPGGGCDGHTPCWADCPAGSTCDFSHDSWGLCRS